MGEQPNVIVRGRCECGRRYRVRNARAGASVPCPQCGRPIRITAADVRAAADAELQPIELDVLTPPEAIPVDDDTLRLAEPGSRPGLTGRQIWVHDEALAADALFGGTLTGVRRVRGPEIGRTPVAVAARAIPDTRILVRELLAAPYLRGNLGDLVTLLANVLLCVGPGIGGHLVAEQLSDPLSGVVAATFTAYVALFAAHFMWRTLWRTAHGQNSVPLLDLGEGRWSEPVLAVLFLAAATAVCALPVVAVWYFVPLAFGPRAALTVAVGLTCSLAWPAVAIVVGCGGGTGSSAVSAWDSMRAIGPAYYLAWGEILVLGGILLGVIVLAEGLPATWAARQLARPVVEWTAILYVGHVIFRILGLLARRVPRLW
jgi:hypothetical protein